MPDISKHHPKQKREEADGEQPGINLSVARRAVSIDDLLKWCRELIELEVSRRLSMRCLEAYIHKRRQILQQLPERVLGDPQMRNHDHLLVFEVIHVNVGLQFHLKK